jgi:DNA-binding CsgD family transcriptional regulator
MQKEVAENSSRRSRSEPSNDLGNFNQKFNIRLTWREVGEARRPEPGRLRFPQVAVNMPCVYRLRLSSGSAGREVWYVAETDDVCAALYALEDDFQLGSTDPMRESLRNALEAAQRIVVDMVAGGVVSVGDAGSRILMDLSRREDRMLLRDVVCATASDVGAEVLKRHPAAASRPGPSCLDCLTPRQRAVVELVGAGLTTKQLASKLGISPRTADLHRQRGMEKLKVHRVVDLVRLLMTS